MLVLGIESTCDETACALVENGKVIRANLIASQYELHRPFNGVFPELASRLHIDTLIPLLKQTLETAHITKEEIDLISVAKGPGLIGALLIGLNTAKGLAFAWKKPFIGVNHVEAHLYASMMPLETIPFPALGVVISGGHTFLCRILEIGSYELIGKTVDDAIGEAFDKVATMLNLSYPGGPAIEALATKGNKTRYPFKPGVVKGHPWNFSFSGLKTNVLYTIKGANATKHHPSIIEESDQADLAASFQEAALSAIVDKALAAAKEFGCQAIFLGGGVSNNQRLRAMFKEKQPNIPIYWPPLNLSLDNGVMIAGLAYHQFLKHPVSDPFDLIPLPKIPFTSIG